MTRILALLLLSAVSSFAQFGDTDATFTVTKETTGTSEKVTIQKPASGSRSVRLVSALVYCSVECTVTQSRNGTAATTTTLTSSIKGNNPESASTSNLTAYHTSNVGAGTAIGGTVTVFAGAPGVSLDLSKIKMYGDGTAINYSLAVASSTSGTLRITLMWDEF